MTKLGRPTGSWRDADAHFFDVIESPWYKLIFRLSAEIVYQANDFFRSRNFFPALTPVTAGSITSPMGLGSDSLPVSIELFGRQTYLADSMQFHLEYLLRQYGDGVFYIMPTFRGEDPDKRHLNEFFHLEAEFAGELDDCIRLIEGLVLCICQGFLGRYADEIAQHAGSVRHVERAIRLFAGGGLPRITFREAERLLGDDENHYVWLERDRIALTSSAEVELMKQVESPVWVTHFPSAGVPFYQARAEDPRYSLSADLLMGIGEVIGCGQRHVDADQTLQAIQQCRVDAAPYGWYLRMKEHYPMQTSGFGIGLERLLAWALAHDDIRDIQLIVRQKGVANIP